MTTKIVDVADEIYREMSEPSDLSIASIAFWLRTNIGDLNITINKDYIINETTLEVESPTEEAFGVMEKSIFKMLFSIHYYERLLRNALGAASVDGTVEVDQNGFRAKKVNKNELAKTYAELRKQISDELMELTKNYNLNEAKPLQVAGDDTIESSSRSYNYSIRNTESL